MLFRSNLRDKHDKKNTQEKQEEEEKVEKIVFRGKNMMTKHD